MDCWKGSTGHDVVAEHCPLKIHFQMQNGLFSVLEEHLKKQGLCAVWKETTKS
jgi:hypothetical protein